MADVSITPSAVIVADGVPLEVGEIGEAVDAGQILVFDSTNNYYVLASNASSILSGGGRSNYLRLAVASGATGQRIGILPPGNLVTVNAVLTPGRFYVLSVDGAISLENDATTGDFATSIGYAVSTTQLYFNPVSTGVEI